MSFSHSEKNLAWQAREPSAIFPRSLGGLRMGERYRDGDGVAQDLRLAREWFAKAAAQGDKHAALELQKLPQNDPFVSSPH